MNVLIAEDEPVSAKLLATALKIGGHEATIAPNGGDAWDSWLLAQQRVVISDWEMPELDGLELCRLSRPHDDRIDERGREEPCERERSGLDATLVRERARRNERAHSL